MAWLYVSIVLVLFLVVVAAGVTNSSIGMPALQSNPAGSGVLFGTPQAIRSDEYLRSTPILLGFMASHGTYAETPLAVAQGLSFALPGSGLFENVSFFDSVVLRTASFLPDASVFAAYWWFPTLLLLLALPFWLCRLGVKKSLAALATGLVILAPANLWWSMMPVRIMGFLFAGAAMALLSAEWLAQRRLVPAVTAMLLAGVLWSRLGTYYVPWSIVLSPPIILATFYWIWRTGKEPRANIKVILGVSVTTLIIFCGVLLENRAQLSALLGTVYPGDRHSGAESTSLAQLFGAPFLFSNKTGPILPGYNQSEISSAYLICLVWAVVLLGVVFARARSRNRVRRQLGPVVLVALGSCLIWTLWASLDASSMTSFIPLMNRVPAKRAAQVVGFLAILGVVLALTYVDKALDIRVALGSAAVCGAISAVVGISMKSTGDLTIIGVVVPAVAVTVAVFSITWQSGSTVAAAAVLCLAAILVYQINPIQYGLSGLRNSTAAGIVRDFDASSGDGAAPIWAADSTTVDALLMSNAIVSVSGQQNSGPNKAMWQLLDPDDRYIDVWNRGASYITFEWSADEAPVIHLGPSRDVIVVQIDPCSVAMSKLHVALVVSHAPMSGSTCLKPIGEFLWGGAASYVYSRSS